MTLKKLLESLGACEDAKQWIEKRTLKKAWLECERGDWMLWLCGRMQNKKGWPEHKQVVFAACKCARISLSLFEKYYPKDNRPRIAIETTEKWIGGSATIEEVRTAAYAVNAACVTAYAAANAAACVTAYAAANAAACAAYTVYAAACATVYAVAHASASAIDTAYAVAHAAACAIDTTNATTQKKCANICRKYLKIPTKAE